MQIPSINNYQPNFQANLRLTPFTKEVILGLSTKHQTRFIEVQKNLNLLENTDELLLSRRVTSEGKVIPVITNLKTGAMLADLENPIRRFGAAAIDLLEQITALKPKSKRIFSKNIVVINEMRDDILKNTNHLPMHPTEFQKLKSIDIADDLQLSLKKLEHKFPDKEMIFSLKNDQKLFIQQYDEGYIYYLSDKNNIPTGQYFTATYTQDGFKLNYNDTTISEEKVIKIFDRYTKKALERLSK